LLALGALVCTLLATWPLARCLDRCLGEPPDTLLTVYFLSWLAHAVLTPGVRLMDATLFAPYAGTLALGEYMPGYAPISVPLIAVTGNPVLVNNVLIILSHAAAALGAVALAHRLTGSLAAALLAGAAFAYAPRLFDQAYNVQTLAVFWFPWLLLAIERVFRRPSWSAAALVAGLWVALALSCLNLFVYGTVLAAVFVAAAVTLGGRRLTRDHLVRLGAAGAVAALLVIVFLTPNRTLAREWGLGRTLAEVERHSASLADFVALPREDLLHRALGRPIAPDHERLVPGLCVTVLALAGLIAVIGDRNRLRRPLAPYVVLLAATVVLSLGPTWWSPWGPLPLPYRLLYARAPGFDAIRTPFRFLVFVDLGIALLVAAGGAWWLARGRPAARGAVVGLLVTGILLESVAVPYPGARPRLDPASLPEVYRWLGAQPPRTLALGVPMGDWVNVAAGAFHLRPIVNGWSSFEPPLYGALTRAMERFPDERTLALIQGLGVDVILVDHEWLTAERRTALERFAATLRPERAFPTHLVFRVERRARPGVEVLEATAGVLAREAGQPGQACVTLANRGSGFVPLYPLHRLHLTAEAASVGAFAEGLRWLPLDLPPGGAHTACLLLDRTPSALRVRGELEAPGRTYRFVLAPDGPPQPVASGRSEPVR
jgi:hypothetical protein